MNTLALFVAYRYLTFKDKDKSISFMISICFLGILIGTFALMLTLIITNGFEKTISEKMQGASAQIIVSCPGNKLDYQELRTALLKEFLPYAPYISGNMVKQALIDQNNNQSVVFLKGVDPINEPTVTTLAQKLLRKKNSPDNSTQLFSQLLQNNNILIGYKMASENHIHVGDEITLLIPEPGSRNKIFLNKKRVTVGGVFKIGLDEYDNNFALCSLDFIQETFNEKGVDNVTIKLPTIGQTLTLRTVFASSPIIHKLFWQNLWDYIQNNISQAYAHDAQEQRVIHALKTRFSHLSINSWKDLYPALVSSLTLEKYVMFFILALITLVACMNMISLLFMQIQQKQRDIAIFKAMGMADNHIRNVFLILGLFITSLASLCGLALAALTGYFLEQYPFIQLPDVYYVSHLPARMEPALFVIVFLATMLLGFLATWIPAQKSKRLQVATVLRNS